MLFFRECKKILFTLTFLVYSLAACAMYFSQFHGDLDEPIAMPDPGMDSYGFIARESPDIMVPAAIESLVGEYLSGSYTAYPYGFIKYVRLTESEKSRIADIIFQVSGITKETLDSFENYDPGGYYMDENGSMVYIKPVIPEINIPTDLTYERFRNLMREADKIIGGGSRYSDDFIVQNFSRIPKTYEDALAEYEQFINDDKITGAYARLYCDYMGIVVAVLPVFPAAALANQDRKSHMDQLVYSKKISSGRLVATRFFSLVAVTTIPVFVTAVIANIKIYNLYSSYTMDQFAFFRYTLFWLVPNIMTATAVGMLITEVSSGLLAIFVQGAWWFASVFTSSGRLTGNIGRFTLEMRHNSLSDRDVFYAVWENIVFNRVFFTLMSCLAVALTVLIYAQKRRGKISDLPFQIHNKNTKRQS